MEIDTFRPPGDDNAECHIGDYDFLEEAMSAAKPLAKDPKYCYCVYDDKGRYIGGFDGEWFQKPPEVTIASKKLEQAEKFAREKHSGKFRNNNITPYSYHLERVVTNARRLGIQDEDILCAAWLHDTVEDTDTTPEAIENRFGKEVASIVAQVSKDKRLEKAEREKKYIEQLGKAFWKADAVKFCDIWANIEDLDSGYDNMDEKLQQIKKKLGYFAAIRAGLLENKDRIPKLDKGLNSLNSYLSAYDVPHVSLQIGLVRSLKIHHSPP